MEEKREEREKDRGQQQTRDDGRIRTGGMGGAQGGQATGPGGRYRSGTAGGGMGDAMYGGAGGTRDRRRGGQTQQDGMYGPGYGGDSDHAQERRRENADTKPPTRRACMAMMYGTGHGDDGQDLHQRGLP